MLSKSSHSAAQRLKKDGKATLYNTCIVSGSMLKIGDGGTFQQGRVGDSRKDYYFFNRLFQ